MDARIFKGAFSFGSSTATAGTIITRLIPGLTGRKARITSIGYRSGSTAHTLSLLRPLDDGYVTTAVAATGTSLVLDALLGPTGNTVAANDWVAVKLSDGRFHLSTVSSWTLGTLTLVLTTALPSDVGVAANAPIYFFGLPADTGNMQLLPAASATTLFADTEGGIFTTGLPSNAYASATFGNRSGNGDPIMIHSDNATAQSWITHVSGAYVSY